MNRGPGFLAIGNIIDEIECTANHIQLYKYSTLLSILFTHFVLCCALLTSFRVTLLIYPWCRKYASVNRVSIGSGKGLAPNMQQLSHYPNQCWFIVNGTVRNKFQWKLNRNSNIFVNENALENVICEKVGILSKRRWDTGTGTVPGQQPWRICVNGLHETINSLWPSDVIWQQKSGSTLAQVMASCLTAPSHYLNQCWLIISKVLWYLSEHIMIKKNLMKPSSKARLKITFL